MKLQNPKSERIYEVKGPVYTNDVSGVWCGTVKDEALGSLFVKIQIDLLSCIMTILIQILWFQEQVLNTVQ